MQAGVLIGKPQGEAIARRIKSVFDGLGVPCRVSKRLARNVEGDFFSGLDVLFSIGGDGTILASAQHAGRLGIPVLGVNLGRLGFLTEVEPEAAEDAARKVAAGDYRIERRTMLEADLEGQRVFALNEILLESTQRGRMMCFEQVIDQGVPDRIACDGVMVSSPTGSTAYSLSCGGPILAPELDAMVVTTVCAHTLRSRPLVISPKSSVVLRAGGDAKSAVYADGQKRIVLKPGGTVAVKRAPFDFQMIRFARGDFFDLVRNKLSEWSYL